MCRGVGGADGGRARKRWRQPASASGSRERASDTVKKGDVIETRPGEGTPVERGSTVTLYISPGPEKVAVPDVVGKHVETRAHRARRTPASRSP